MALKWCTRMLRRLVLPIFERLNVGDIRIRHHYTGAPMRLHSFRHKAYWFRGKRRDAETMQLFARLLRPGMTALDVGGHVGYVAMYLAELVAPQGRVYVFEPGPNNLPYIRHNVGQSENIVLVEKGVGSRNEQKTFFVENITGQNNSFVEDFPGLERRKKEVFASRSRVSKVPVELVTLDGFCQARALRPDFIKIDVEGFEGEVLRGAAALLEESRPAMVVEVQADHGPIFELMSDLGYLLLDVQTRGILPAPGAMRAFGEGNVLCLHREAHAAIFPRLCRFAA